MNQMEITVLEYSTEKWLLWAPVLMKGQAQKCEKGYANLRSHDSGFSGCFHIY